MTGLHAERLQQLLDGPIDWDTLWKLAAQQGILLLLFQNLRVVRPDRLPAGFLKRLQARSQTRLISNLRLTHELLRILGVLEQHTILAVPLKGPALTIMAYGSLAL